jgi:hypothetical protein
MKVAERAKEHGVLSAVHWLLRLGIAMEFVGHGAFGVMTKAGWVPYVTVFGFSDQMAWKLMPVIGTLDIGVFALSALCMPVPGLLLYMSGWGLFTALLRPLTGEEIWEVVERSYNFGMPLCLWYFYYATHKSQGPLRPVQQRGPFALDAAQINTVMRLLRYVMAGMLIGHGALGAFAAKPIYVELYQSIGLDRLGYDVATIKVWIGHFEIGLGILCLYVKRLSFFVFIFLWKTATEFLYLTGHVYGKGWEFVERGGSYVAPVVFILLLLYAKHLSEPQATGGSGKALEPSKAA